MAPFTGDNGGATAPGVTADEITLVNYVGQEGDPIIAYITDAIDNDDTTQQYFDTMKGLVDYYSAFYELYGRKINLVTFEGTGGATDEVAARADAATIAEQYSPFAVLGGPALTSAFADELSARQVLCIGCTPGQPAELLHRPRPVRLGPRRQRTAEAGARAGVHREAADRQERRARRRRRQGARRESFGLVYLESSGASKDLADRSPPRWKQPVRRSRPCRPTSSTRRRSSRPPRR